MKTSKRSKNTKYNSKKTTRKTKLNVRVPILAGLLVLVAMFTASVAVTAMRRDDPDFGRGIITISFVNGYKSQYSAAQNQMKALNIPATYFMPTNLIDKPNRMSLKDLQTLSHQGHEMGNMTADTKSLLGKSESQVFKRYSQTNSWFEENVGVTPKTCFYPGSPYQNDPYSEDLVLPSPIRKAVQDSRLGFDGCVMNAGGMMLKGHFDNWRVESAIIPKTVTLYEMQHMINNVVGARSWVNITFVQVGEEVNPDEPYVSQELVDQTMEHLNYWRSEGQLTVTDIKGALEIIRNQ